LERIYEFNVLWQNGVPAFLLMVYLIFFFIKKQRDYLFEGKDTLGEKFVFIALILAIFIRFSLFDDEMPLIHASEQAFIPFLSSNMHYALMALLGLTYVPMKAKEKEVAVHE
jgi:Na+/citrate or Na+/malate symporter